MAKVICKNKHEFKASKDGPFWPVKCPRCGAEAAPPSWWEQNPNGTTVISMHQEPKSETIVSSIEAAHALVYASDACMEAARLLEGHSTENVLIKIQDAETLLKKAQRCIGY